MPEAGFTGYGKGEQSGMKKSVIVVMLVVMLMISGCGKDVAESDSGDDSSMFVSVERTGIWRVVYHKDTKVMYAVSFGGYNSGTFTLLVDRDGKPLLWEDKNE